MSKSLSEIFVWFFSLKENENKQSPGIPADWRQDELRRKSWKKENPRRTTFKNSIRSKASVTTGIWKVSIKVFFKIHLIWIGKKSRVLFFKIMKETPNFEARKKLDMIHKIKQPGNRKNGGRLNMIVWMTVLYFVNYIKQTKKTFISNQ